MKAVTTITKKIALISLGIIFFSFCSKKNIEPSDGSLNEGKKKQKTTIIKLSANESFFSPVGTLRAFEVDKTSGNEYNRGSFLSHIYSWSVKTDTILFGINVPETGVLTIKPEMGVGEEQSGSQIYVYLDNERKPLKLISTGAPDNYKIQGGVDFELTTTGFHVVKLQIKSTVESGDIGNLKNIHITGPEGTRMVQRRWRPEAVHAKWGSDASEVEISVHEIKIISTHIDSYQPITTPFGYTGSTWSVDSQTFGGYNFSLWSYGANDPVPPFYQESHLIAVGPNLIFGSYGHEGTGVKPRGDHPYIGLDTDTQVIAVRKQPGKLYDTYWSYYLCPIDGHWKLYGCGKKFNKTGDLTPLSTGAFVEVPGPAVKVRSGHVEREVQFKGWQMDQAKQWHNIDQMTSTSKLSNNTSKEWGQNPKGNGFFMRMGGWDESPSKGGTNYKLSNPPGLPFFLKGDYLDELYRMPSSFEDLGLGKVKNTSATLKFDVSDLGSEPTAELFWGTEEGLTKEEKWKNHKSIDIQKGLNPVLLEDLNPNTKYYYRIRITNNEGITWSFDTQTFKTRRE